MDYTWHWDSENFRLPLGLARSAHRVYKTSVRLSPLPGGVNPTELPVGDDYQEVLKFCYDNVYHNLGEPAKGLANILLASRQELSRAQLQDYWD